MDRTDYYTDRKFCDHCEGYVPYLMSVDASYCVECGSKVHLFSKEDWESFHENLANRRRGGRPRTATRARGKESA